MQQNNPLSTFTTLQSQILKARLEITDIFNQAALQVYTFLFTDESLSETQKVEMKTALSKTFEVITDGEAKLQELLSSIETAQQNIKTKQETAENHKEKRLASILGTLVSNAKIEAMQLKSVLMSRKGSLHLFESLLELHVIEIEQNTLANREDLPTL